MAPPRKKLWKYTIILNLIVFTVFTLMSIAYFGFPSQLGRTWARFDLLRNHYEVRVYGLSFGDRDNAELLKPYGISYVRVAGCVVNTPIIESTNAYNAVMREAITRDLGVDVHKLLY